MSSVSKKISKVASATVEKSEFSEMATETTTTVIQETMEDTSGSTTTTTTTKKVKSKKSSAEKNGTETTNGKKKSKKSKKSDAEKENHISVKSSFSKFDALQKKNYLNVRSSDSGKAQEKFNGKTDVENNCRSCGKIVYKMEEMKAERNTWHKNCFRCSECNKQLNVDTYQSHEAVLYCKPHFKALFSPKAVEDTEPVTPRKPELIIRESNPTELPPDVMRSSDKPDLGLEELHQLNVKERFQAFESAGHEDDSAKFEDKSPCGVKRSASILSKLAKFQSKGMDIGVSDDALNGVTIEESSSDEEYEEGDDVDLIRAKKAQRERPLSFANMSDIQAKFESGHIMTKEERREERKQEIQSIRSRLFMGKQAKIKEMYQQAVADSEQGIRSVDKKQDFEIGDKAKNIKAKFEMGKAYNDGEEESSSGQLKQQDEDQAVFEQGICKKSRSLFMELDANASKTNNGQPLQPGATPTRTPDSRKSIQVSQLSASKLKMFSPDEVVKCDERVDEIKIETADISNKFKFFETYKPEAKEKKTFRITPPRDGVLKQPSPDRDNQIYHDPDVVRSNAHGQDDPAILAKSNTATKMLSWFRQMESNGNDDDNNDGPKPLKRFTPPPDEGRRVFNESDSGAEYSDTEEDDEDEDEDEEASEDEQQLDANYVRSSDKHEDEFLQAARSAARAKQLRAKFEKWESDEIKREQNNSSASLYDGANNDDSQVESAKSIRARFESMREPASQTEIKPRTKVNRFV